MKKLLQILFFSFTIIAFSQSNRGTSNINDGFTSKKGNVKGHPYLLQNWLSGYFISSNGSLSEEKYLNYDIYTNNLTFKNDVSSDDVLVITDSKYTGFIFTDASNTNYSFKKVDGASFKKQKKNTKYYQLVDAETEYVILEATKILKDPNASGWSSSSLSTKSAEYILKTTIYVLDDTEHYVKVSATKSSLLKALKTKKQALSNFIKAQNIEIKSENDLVSILKYYHTL